MEKQAERRTRAWRSTTSKMTELKETLKDPSFFGKEISDHVRSPDTLFAVKSIHVIFSRLVEQLDVYLPRPMDTFHVYVQ
jgi:hypothetical protein